MMKSMISAFVLTFFALFVSTHTMGQSAAEAKGAPMTSSAQEMNQRNTIPKNFTTEIIVVDDEGRKRAQKIIGLYELLSNKPTIKKVLQYVREDYVQHSPMLPDGPQGLAMFFHGLNAQYPVKIDIYRIMVIGDWAMAHVNFRNLDTEDPNDLGNAGVDIYTFGPDGRLSEHWDAVQGVPTFSVNSNGMFLKVRND
ncbi:MAG: nuclear transport factor 2 family protein [Bacteroidota bacterium]